MGSIAQEVWFRQRVMEYQRKHQNVTETSNRYHLSRKTVHKWIKRWDGTKESLQDRSRAPHHKRPGHTEKDIQLIRRLAKKHHWTDIIVAYQEAVEGYQYKYTYQCFKRKVRELFDQKAKKKKSRKNKPYQRAEYPGQKVQVDVKFVPSECVTDHKKYYVYVAVDECSRWTYRQMYDEHSTYSSAEFLKELVNAAPFQIRMIQTDNGSEFTKACLDTDDGNKTSFELLLQEYGILYHRIRPATPRHNGKVERQNRIDQDRFYDHLRMFSLADGRKQLAVYQKKSNNIWKLCLGLKSPNDIIAAYLACM